MLSFANKSCPRSGRRTHAFGIVMLLLAFLSMTTMTPTMRSLSFNWSFSTTTKSNHYHFSRIDTVFLDGQPFDAKLRTLYRNMPEFTDVTQSYPYADSTDYEGIMEHRIFPQHDHDDKCVPMADWQSIFYPTCNEFHAFDTTAAFSDRDFWMISNKGYWRHAWEIVENRTKQWTNDLWDEYSHDSSIVLRTFKLEHAYEEGYFENNRVDAIAMERLTKSPYVINMFGFCGMSVLTEYAGQHVGQVVDTLDPLQKLELAKMIAQGVNDVHSIGGEVSLVHNDLNFANILIGKNHSRPLLNDFNIAVLMMKRNDTGEACPFTSHFPNPQWRAPEEQVDEHDMTSKLLTEKIDIYALGNVMYRFAVGHSPWNRPDGHSLTTEQKLDIATRKIKEGALPEVPDEVRDSQEPATMALLSTMSECYQHRPELRPSAKEIVDQLQRAIDDYKAQSKESEQKGDKEELTEKDNDRKLKRSNDGKTKDSHEKVAKSK
jgi:serine/threonine protein kinase